MRPPRTLHDETVTLVTVTYGAPDASGVPVETTTNTPWVGVNVQQESTSENTIDHRTQTVERYRVSGPTLAITPRRIIRDGVTFDVVGEVDTTRGRHRINRSVLTMQRVKGA